MLSLRRRLKSSEVLCLLVALKDTGQFEYSMWERLGIYPMVIGSI